MGECSFLYRPDNVFLDYVYNYEEQAADLGFCIFAHSDTRLRFFGRIAGSAPDEDHHRAVLQLLLRFASLHQTGNDLQEDPTTRGSTGSEPLNRI